MKKLINGKLIEMTAEEIAEITAFENSKEAKLLRLECRIKELKQMLNDTDYIACKIAEGVATKEEYREEVSQRQLWREEINSLNEMMREMLCQ